MAAGRIDPNPSSKERLPPPPASERLVLRATRAIQPRTGARIEPAFVDVRDGKVASIGTKPPTDAPPAIDLGDVTLIPGLIDAHTHLLDLQTPRDSAIVVGTVMLSETERALRGAAYARQMLQAGFTAVRDLGNSGHGADVALRNAIRIGWVEGPTMVVSTRALAPPGGQFPPLPSAHQGIIEQE